MPADPWMFFGAPSYTAAAGNRLAPDEFAIQAALRGFLLAILPAGTEVLLSQVNRVAEPASPNFVMMTPLRRRRIETNIDECEDAKYSASIAGTTLTVVEVFYGAIAVGNPVMSPDVEEGTVIAAFGSGSGGAGTYQVSRSQTVALSDMAGGVSSIEHHTEITYQLDVHGPASTNNVQTIATLFRDEFATHWFEDSPVMPLHADDPRQAPFLNAEQQYENRWVLEAVMQANQTVFVPQQFAEALHVGLINVDSTYPA